MMSTRSMSRSGSATTTGKRKTRSGQGTGSSTGKATLKLGTSARPPVLGKRDANRQTKLTSVMRSTVVAQHRVNYSRVGPSNSATIPVASTSGTLANTSTPSVIVLTSDDEDDGDDDILLHPGLPSEVNAGSKRKEPDNGETSNAEVNQGKGKGKEVISDAPFVNFLKADNEELKQKYAKKSKEFERQKEDTVKTMHENSLLKLRIQELEKRALERRKSDVVRAPPLDLSGAEDLISCPVCTTTMWHPATISECGHTFCETCLYNWFKSTYEQHATAHPEFVAGPYISPEYVARRKDPRVARAIQALIEQWKTSVPQPKYTCPACRADVEGKPIEVYFVKEAVSKMAKLMKDSGNGNDVGRPAPRMNRTGGGLWDGFFPEPPL